MGSVLSFPAIFPFLLLMVARIYFLRVIFLESRDLKVASFYREDLGESSEPSFIS